LKDALVEDVLSILFLVEVIFILVNNVVSLVSQ